MMHRKLVVTIAVSHVALAVATAPVVAGEIYRYTDDDGTIHYVDRPTGEPTEKRLAISSAPTDDAAVQARVAERYKARDEEEEEEADARPTRAERAAERRAQEQKCQDARDRLETMVTSRRLYREDESGERVYLEENEILEARNKAQELVEKHCG